MEKYMDDFENYKRFAHKCKCGCDQHCNTGCSECDYCPDCECERCLTGKGYD